MTARELAERFHEAYERLAPSFGYETRKASAKPWNHVPENNRNLMEAVCQEVMVPALSERERAVWEQAAKLAEGSRPIANGNAFRAQRDICSVIAKKCRQQAREGQDGH